MNVIIKKISIIFFAFLSANISMCLGMKENQKEDFIINNDTNLLKPGVQKIFNEVKNEVIKDFKTEVEKTSKKFNGIAQELSRKAEKLQQEVEKIKDEKNDTEQKTKIIEKQFEADMSKILLTLQYGAPIVAGIILVTILSYFIVKYGYETVNRYFNIPSIIHKTNLKGFSLGFIFNYLFGRNTFNALKNLSSWQSNFVYPQKTFDEINAAIAQQAMRMQLNKNLAIIGLFGPPGTGKTMLAESLATTFDAYSVEMRGGLIRAAQLDQAIQQVRAAIDRCVNADKPVVVFIDEANACFESRLKGDTFASQFLSFLLPVLEDAAIRRRVMFVYATNISQLDKAILDRTDIQIEVPLPDQPALISLIKLYLDKSITKEPVKYIPDPQGRMQEVKLKISNDVLTEDFLLQVAQKLKGASGRIVKQLCARLADASYYAPKYTLTRTMVLDVVNSYINAKSSLKKDFLSDGGDLVEATKSGV